MADAAFGGVCGGAAEGFFGYFFVGNGADDIGSGDEHIACFLDHEDEVGDGWGVDRASRARTEDGADLGNDAGSQGIA